MNLPSMEFSPANNIVRLCLQGMALEEKGKTEEAMKLFIQAWKEATADWEKFLAAWYIARLQITIPDKLKWLETSLSFVLVSKEQAVKSALPTLYTHIAQCHEALNNQNEASVNYEAAKFQKSNLTDTGPFYHGTKAALEIGDLLTAGGVSNYASDLKMNHIYFTAQANGAGLAAALAKGNGPERVYIVEPTSSFENDPNVTDSKFPGNLTRSYRSAAPLKIVGEMKDWHKLPPEQIQKLRDSISNSKEKIIN